MLGGSVDWWSSGLNAVGVGKHSEGGLPQPGSKCALACRRPGFCARYAGRIGRHCLVNIMGLVCV